MRQLRHTSELAALLGSAEQSPGCHCSVGACPGWVSLTPERWPSAQMQQIATLRDPAVDEPSFEEKHPHGTRYESEDAPVAIAFYPYNRCDLWKCSRCLRLLMRYTEFGGYYVDHRVRELGPGTPLLDTPAPDHAP